MASGSYRQANVMCPYYRSDDGKHVIICEGILPGSVVKSFFYRKTDYTLQMDKFCCCKTYWSCEICQANNNKYIN